MLAAKYCEMTLIRQLPSALASSAETHIDMGSDTADTSGLEWAKNVTRLSDFFLSNDNYGKAAHCLAAAGKMVARMWAKWNVEGKHTDTGDEVKGGAQATVDGAATTPAATTTTTPAATAASAGGGAGGGAGAGAGSGPTLVEPEPSGEPQMSAEEEELRSVDAELAMHWGRLYVLILETARDKRLADDLGEDVVQVTLLERHRLRTASSQHARLTNTLCLHRRQDRKQ